MCIRDRIYGTRENSGREGCGRYRGCDPAGRNFIRSTEDQGMSDHQ